MIFYLIISFHIVFYYYYIILYNVLLYYRIWDDIIWYYIILCYILCYTYCIICICVISTHMYTYIIYNIYMYMYVYMYIYILHMCIYISLNLFANMVCFDTAGVETVVNLADGVDRRRPCASLFLPSIALLCMLVISWRFLCSLRGETTGRGPRAPQTDTVNSIWRVTVYW